MQIPVSKAVLPALFAFLIALALVGIALNDPLIALHEKWTTWDGAYSHGYLLVGVCAYLLFSRLFSVKTVKPVPGFSVFAVLPALLWSAGFATQTTVLAQLSLPLFVFTLLLPLYGWRIAISVLPIIGVLFIAVPLWEVLLPLLRDMTTAVSTAVVRWVGVPAFIDGYAFTLPYGTVLIAGSCAGLSYFLMALALSSLNAIYRAYSFRSALISIGLLAVLSVIGNWVRVIALILIAYSSKMQSSLVADHGSFGWWIFSATFVLFLWLIRKLPEGELKQTRVTAAPVGIQRLSGTLVLTLFFALALPSLAKFNQPAGNTELKTMSDSSFTAVKFKAASEQLQLSYSGYDQAEFYQKELEGYDWLVGRLVYFTQAQGKELISDGQQITQLITQRDWLAMADQTVLPIEVHTGRNARLFASVYLIGEAIETDPVQGKVQQLAELVQGRREAALWLVSTKCEVKDCSDVIEVLQRVNATDALIRPLKLY